MRETSFADYDHIAALLRRNGLCPRARREWTALWEGNPVVARNHGRWPIGWVLENEEGQIVGSIANVPGAYMWKGALILAAAECDWAVDPAYRPYSMSLLQRITNQPGVDLLLTTTVGAGAEPCYAAFQWSKVPAGRWDRAGLWITGYRGFLRSALRKRFNRQGARAAGLAIPLSAFAMACRDRLRRLAPLRPSALAIERAFEFDDRFDTFWWELVRRKPDVLLAVRSAAVLRWHFAASSQVTWIVTASRGANLVAYAIFSRYDNPEIGLKRLRVTDFQAIADTEECFEQILTWALDRCRREGIYVLEDMGCNLERLGIPRAKAPYHRSLTTWAYYYRAKRADLRDALRAPAAWDPTTLDGDASL